MRETTNPGKWLQRWALRVCAVGLIGLSSGAAFAAPLESAGSPATAPAAPRGVKTAAIKKAIKVVVKALRSTAAADTAAMLTKEGATASVRRVAVKHAATIATRLEGLLKYEDLVLQTIEDQVKNALTNVGVADGMATIVGFFVKKAVEAAL
jgi:hypothetical protein